MQSKPVPDVQTEALEQRKAEPAKTLRRRNGEIAVVMEFKLLTVQAFGLGQSVDIADLVVRADEQRMFRVAEKRADRTDLGFAGMLSRSRRVEADDDERIDAGKERAV